MNKYAVEPERVLTKRDWLAAKMVFTLWTQVIEHGEDARWRFVDGISEARRRTELSDRPHELPTTFHKVEGGE